MEAGRGEDVLDSRLVVFQVYEVGFVGGHPNFLRFAIRLLRFVGDEVAADKDAVNHRGLS